MIIVYQGIVIEVDDVHVLRVRDRVLDATRYKVKFIGFIKEQEGDDDGRRREADE